MWHSQLCVSCWFCGQDTVINVKDKEKWICQGCDQQNGFDEVRITLILVISNKLIYRYG